MANLLQEFNFPELGKEKGDEEGGVNTQEKKGFKTKHAKNLRIQVCLKRKTMQERYKESSVKGISTASFTNNVLLI